jgi:WD40-like Beta Propeller Repeat
METKMKKLFLLIAITSLTMAFGCDDDSSNNDNNINSLNNINNINNVNCVDIDQDTHKAYDATTCPTGDDMCDDDSNNYSQTGCDDCVDNDSDGYGTDCDMGADCDDDDNTLFENCIDCLDIDADGHDSHDATTCPTGDDMCDDDGNNYTQNGCDNCVDNDSDGYGTDCDMGADCDDNDINTNTLCVPMYDICFSGDHLDDGSDQLSCYNIADSSIVELNMGPIISTDSFDGVTLAKDQIHYAISGLDSNGDSILVILSKDSSDVQIVATTAAAHTVEFTNLSFSPDSSYIAFTADIEVNGSKGLYVVPTDGSSSPTAIISLTDSALDISALAWSPIVSGSERYLAYYGDPTTNDEYGLWVVDVAATNPVSVTIETIDASSGFDFDAAGLLYYKLNVSGIFQLWTSTVDGSTKTQLSSTVLTNAAGDASIGAFSISPSGNYIAFSSNSPSERTYDLYVMDLSISTPNRMSEVGQTEDDTDTRGVSTWEKMAWNYDETSIAIIADWKLTGDTFVDNDYCAYIIPTSGTAGGVRVMTPINADANQDVANVMFNWNGTGLYILGDLVNNNNSELFYTSDLTTKDQDSTTLLLQGVVSGGDIDNIHTQY